MKKEKLYIQNIPAIVYGKKSDSVCLFIHGQNGNKEEAEPLAQIVNSFSCQMISVDLPGHGERINEISHFDPWHTLPELSLTMEYVKKRWSSVSLFANSIGAWFSMLAFEKEIFDRALFVSPVLDMPNLISKMMIWASVSEEQLYQERVISTSFGQTLSWEYLKYAREHPIKNWKTATRILYGENDDLTEADIVNNFAQKHKCKVTVMEQGEHWFHTQKQLDVLYGWTEKCFHEKNEHLRNLPIKVFSEER